MKILHVTDNFPPSPGGLEGAVASLADLQATAGHQVAVATGPHRTDPVRSTRPSGARLWRLPMSLARLNVFEHPDRVFFPTLPDPVFTPAFRRLISGWRPDIVHCHGWSMYSVLSACEDLGVPVVATAHDYGAVCARKDVLRHGTTPCPGPSLRQCVSCAVTTYGPKGVAVATGLFISSRRHRVPAIWTGLSDSVTGHGSAPIERHRVPMRTIPSYVADTVLAEAATAARPDWVGTDPYVFFAGQIKVHKGVSVLIEAFARALDQGIPVRRLVLAGRSEGSVSGIGAEFVTCAGQRPHPEVLGAWRHATCGVVPSLWPEPFGQVAVECLAAGTPVLVSDSGGLPDIIAGTPAAGRTFPTGDPVALGGALVELLNDPAAGPAAQIAGPVRAAQFSVSAVAPIIEAAYRDALVGTPMQR